MKTNHPLADRCMGYIVNAGGKNFVFLVHCSVFGSATGALIHDAIYDSLQSRGGFMALRGGGNTLMVANLPLCKFSEKRHKIKKIK